ncbi:PAS domain-containing protein [Methylobacterium sp. J-068]|uniref:PAS domain-containing protein n=1 Tax=Methylobacterium sp. J-068 TaxID=2836649 RepID=UPI001FBBFF77|nr:PAS domain-containing protein [Methylobacterium sp. J-068]MCJ2036187.1 PAS domain-containing protein [Methylobacterium sp. J-068]
MTRFPFPAPDAADNPDGLRAALAASGVVGVWLHDIWADRLTVSAPLGRALGLTARAGADGVPLAALLDATHADDRARVENGFHAAIARGGTFALAFRTTAPRWLDLRGRIERDASGRPARARGIVLDLTEDRVSAPQHRVNRMAEHAIALRGLAGDLEHAGLTRLLDHLMVEIGFELARHLRDAPDGQRH